jgi:hypothetical protein
MPGMTGMDAPRPVRIATLVTWLLVPAGLLLVVDGLLELRWLGTPSATKLTEIFAQIKAQPGVEPPPLLRGRSGAAELVVLGVVCCAVGFLAPSVGRGLRWARNTGLVAGLGAALFGLVGIGADQTTPQTIGSYFTALTNLGAGARIQDITPLLYANWYPWLEDIAQGVQVVVALAAAAALAWAGIADADYFRSRASKTADADDWDSAISRIHRQTVRPKDSD